MEVCSNCGHRLGVGRFCTNCGRRVDHASDPDNTADRDEVPTLPPPAVETPSKARYPLFADDVVVRGEDAPPPTAPSVLPPPPLQPEPTRSTPGRAQRSRAGWLPWAVGAVALLLVAMIGALLLVGDDDEGNDAHDPADDRATAETTAQDPSNRPRTPKPSETPPAGQGPLDVARYAAADVPDTAPPNEDVSGNLVSYDWQNMLDGVPETCWRMPGSGAGDEIVFTFQAPVEFTEVGLVNGYAKTSGDFDWYNGNRRVLDVEWVFDDGTVVAQSLDETRKMQSLPIEAVTSTSVTLRLLEVSDPGRGRSARDYTAISDVAMVGEPA